MTTPARSIASLNPLRERLCLDFCNTAERETAQITQEWLTDYAALVAWGETAQVLTPTQAHHLRHLNLSHPEVAARVFEQAIALREALYQIFSARAAQQPVPTSALTVLNQQLSQALPHLCLQPTPEGFDWQWQSTELTLEQVLWPVIHCAARVLTSPELRRVRECAAPDCGWLFIDLSRNHSRRWCDMETCGNRIKAQRHYTRQRQGNLRLPKNAE